MPIILDDGTFISYGGQTGTSTAIQRQIAYTIAQEQIELYIGTFLTPTVVTGTFPFPYPDNRLIFQQSDLRSVPAVWLLDDDPSNGSTSRSTGTSFILSYDNSVINVWGFYEPCLPERVQVVYEAGLAPGVFTGSNSYMMALVALAQTYLQQLYSQLAPPPGAVTQQQIESWSSMTHSETYAKKDRIDSFFGETPLAQMIANLLAPLRKYRAIKLP